MQDRPLSDTPSVEQVMTALKRSWKSDTAFNQSDWSEGNPARGQCVVSALVVQDYFGGDLQRYEVEGRGITETHYANLLDNGATLDTTASQYAQLHITLKPTTTKLKGFASVRDKRLADESTRQRYETLSSRVSDILVRDFKLNL